MPKRKQGVTSTLNQAQKDSITINNLNSKRPNGLTSLIIKLNAKTCEQLKGILSETEKLRAKEELAQLEKLQKANEARMKELREVAS